MTEYNENCYYVLKIRNMFTLNFGNLENFIHKSMENINYAYLINVIGPEGCENITEGELCGRDDNRRAVKVLFTQRLIAGNTLFLLTPKDGAQIEEKTLKKMRFLTSPHLREILNQ